MERRKVATLLALVTAWSSVLDAAAYSRPTVTRRDFGILAASSAAAAVVSPNAPPALAFEGTGSSAYSGKSPTTKASLRKNYQTRVVADVRDFNALGRAIDRGDLDQNSDAWVSFFIPFQRREPDDVGRTYAALADFIGHKGDGKDLEGGDGYLLASTFTKAGKPPENTPAVKSYNALFKSFEPIQAAGKKGDGPKAKAAWEKAATLLSKYLEDVELPGLLSDPIYN